jgi:hypothetical protein
MELHDEYLKMCALSTAGDLTEEEERRLQAHLLGCAECRQALKEFEAAADVGMPLLASKLADVYEAADSARGQSGSPGASVHGREQAEGNSASDSRDRAFAFAHRSGPTRRRVNWSYVWLPFAACVLLSVALAAYTYRVKQSSRRSATPATTAECSKRSWPGETRSSPTCGAR